MMSTAVAWMTLEPSVAFGASAASVVVLACPWVIAGSGEESALGMPVGRARGLQSHRQDFRRQAYPRAHRTPVLYSRNQSRTNRVL